MSFLHLSVCHPQIFESFVQGVIQGATRGQASSPQPWNSSMSFFYNRNQQRDHTTPRPSDGFLSSLFQLTTVTTTTTTTTTPHPNTVTERIQPSFMGSVFNAVRGGIGIFVNDILGRTTSSPIEAALEYGQLSTGSLTGQGQHHQPTKQPQMQLASNIPTQQNPKCLPLKKVFAEGECRAYHNCPVLHEVIKHLPFREFLATYGGCGRDESGNRRLCCPIY
ncbi:hypothetical protein SK128_004570 [Halocaridina rubra]|uniref:Uncharacterized protein n=1 Tax=Halocaridina rubra TaxID=373956 RepID=A0AAN8ZY28_HALRR